MVFVLKVLSGTLAFGGVVATPISLLQSGTFLSENRETNSHKNHMFNDLDGEVTPENKNAKVQKVLKWLKEKNCQLMQNPENENNWSNALYACEKQENGQANFYYVGPENSFITEIESNLIRKVSGVNYLADKEHEIAYLLLNLEDGESINWRVTYGSAWQYFNNTDLSKQCNVRDTELGGDVLACELVDSENVDSLFSYIYSVF